MNNSLSQETESYDKFVKNEDMEQNYFNIETTEKFIFYEKQTGTHCFKKLNARNPSGSGSQADHIHVIRLCSACDPHEIRM